jgi:hypothetical protein
VTAGEAVDAAGIDRDLLAAALPRVDPDAIRVRAAAPWFRALWAEGITAMALPWGIYLHPRHFERPPSELGALMVHELAHIDQWRRLGPWGWARSYLGDYLSGRRRRLGHHGAYRAIGLEVEARDVARRIGVGS